MAAQRIKSLLVAVFSLGIILFSNTIFAQEHGVEQAGGHEPKEEKLDPAKIILIRRLRNFGGNAVLQARVRGSSRKRWRAGRTTN